MSELLYRRWHPLIMMIRDTHSVEGRQVTESDADVRELAGIDPIGPADWPHVGPSVAEVPEPVPSARTAALARPSVPLQ